MTTREVWHPRPRPVRGSVTSPRWTGCAGWPSSPCSRSTVATCRADTSVSTRSSSCPGFLITSLLLAESARHRPVALGRSGPGGRGGSSPRSLCVIGAVALYAAWIAQPEELASIRGDALATLGYVANWRAIFTHNDYWAMFRSPVAARAHLEPGDRRAVLPAVAARGRGAAARPRHGPGRPTCPRRVTGARGVLVRLHAGVLRLRQPLARLVQHRHAHGFDPPGRGTCGVARAPGRRRPTQLRRSRRGTPRARDRRARHDRRARARVDPSRWRVDHALPRWAVAVRDRDDRRDRRGRAPATRTGLSSALLPAAVRGGADQLRLVPLALAHLRVPRLRIACTSPAGPFSPSAWA